MPTWSFMRLAEVFYTIAPNQRHFFMKQSHLTKTRKKTGRCCLLAHVWSTNVISTFLRSYKHQTTQNRWIWGQHEKNCINVRTKVVVHVLHSVLHWRQRKIVAKCLWRSSHICCLLFMLFMACTVLTIWLDCFLAAFRFSFAENWAMSVLCRGTCMCT